MTMPTTPAGWPEAPAQGELFDNAGEPAVPALITHLANPEEEDDEPMPKPADNGEPMPKRHQRLTLDAWIAQPKYAKVTADQAARLFKTSPEGFYVTSDNIRHARRRAAQVEAKRLAAEEEAARQAEEAAEAREREAVSRWAQTPTVTDLEAALGRIADLSRTIEKLTEEVAVLEEQYKAANKRAIDFLDKFIRFHGLAERRLRTLAELRVKLNEPEAF